MMTTTEMCQRLKESLQFEDIKAKWFNQDLHLKNKSLKLKSPEAITYSHALSSMPNLEFPLEKDQDLKFLENTLEVVETFTYNLDKSSSEYTDFKELATRVRIINPNLMKERLDTINRDLKAMARLILGRQLHPRPNLKKQTYAVAWELSESHGISDDEIQPTHEARELPIFPNYIQKYEILVELKSIDNSKQEEVQRTDFGPSGKYRGICKLYIKCAAENFPGETFWFGASGWLIDNRTVVTCGHCVYQAIRSREKLKNYGTLRAVDIRAYIGYCKGTVADSNCMEMRRGIWALTHQEWYEKQDMDCDIAMIRLEKPFDETKTFSYVDKTPKTAENETVFMVGY
ncbi:hypothetical protein F4825DRAFT_444150 [Nemania diffusa]|nr:hypothetical protein F4825DRAFT_444150 [Nemania diffusa]